MAKQDDNPQKITIDGQQHNVNDLSENAKAQIANLRVTDEQIQRLNQQLAITQTARAAYARALEAELPKTEQ